MKSKNKKISKHFLIVVSAACRSEVSLNFSDVISKTTSRAILSLMAAIPSTYSE